MQMKAKKQKFEVFKLLNQFGIINKQTKEIIEFGYISQWECEYVRDKYERGVIKQKLFGTTLDDYIRRL